MGGHAAQVLYPQRNYLFSPLQQSPQNELKGLVILASLVLTTNKAYIYTYNKVFGRVKYLEGANLHIYRRDLSLAIRSQSSRPHACCYIRCSLREAYSSHHARPYSSCSDAGLL